MPRIALVSLLTILLVSSTGSSSGVALAQPANKAEAAAVNDMRMVVEYIDLGEYEVAREKLEKSLEKLKMAGSAVRPVSADTHVMLGIVYVIGLRNTKKATEHFKTAIEIKKDIALPKVANDRAKLVFGRAYEALHPTIKCDQLMGLFHKAVHLAQEGVPTMVEAKLGKHLVGGTMLVLYRGSGGGSFREAPLEKVEGCTYRGAIPADVVNAPKVEYYLEARMKDGRPSARRGKSKVPFKVNVSFGPVADAPEPDPKTVVAQKDLDPEDPAPKNDEVEDLLLKKPDTAKGSGCAGCSTGSQSGGSFMWLLAFCGILVLVRRRRS
jgi:MYXO-CTERM domain-containing protein